MTDGLRIAIPIPEGTRYDNYFDTVRALGAEGVAARGDVDASAFDGLLLPGGGDIDPARYHQRNTGCGKIDPGLDALQFSALDAFVRAKKPVFGICRGLQLINVYFGGTLIQDIPQGLAHRWDGITGEDHAHDSEAVAGSWLEALYGAAFPVNSAHHQAVDALGDGLIVDQRAPDGVIEALRHQSLPIWCVQWHPERMCFAHARPDTVDGSAVLRWFLEMCGQAGRRSPERG